MRRQPIVFPRRKKGRPTKASEKEYGDQVADLYLWMGRYIQRLGFAPSSRGWCYALETDGLINKGEFDMATNTLADLRKKGKIPFYYVASDDNRALEGFDVYHDLEADEHIIALLTKAIKQSCLYRPVSYWKFQEYYPIVMVEKVDLVGLFRPVLPDAVKIFNSRGFPDVNSRVALIKEMMKAEEKDLEPVILYCGDHDPGGLQISDNLREMLREISDTMGYIGLDDLEIIRFGLNEDQIEEAGLTWIENLQTSSGGDLSKKSHKDHTKPYVQDYINQYGVRKVEANALIANPELGRKIMKDEIWTWLDGDAEHYWNLENTMASEDASRNAKNVNEWLCALDEHNLLFSSLQEQKDVVIQAMKSVSPQLNKSKNTDDLSDEVIQPIPPYKLTDNLYD